MEKNLTEAEDLEPLFDYSRVQPLKFTNLDDVESSPDSSKKRRKKSLSVVEKKVKVDVKELEVVNCEEEEEEEDWLPPPPKVLVENQLGEDSTIKELRLKRQELVSFAKAAEDVLRDAEESVKRKLGDSLEASFGSVADQPSKLPCERAKIVISMQDKEGPKQFRVFMDDKFERLFKMYADKVKLDTKNLVFCFDGDKIGPASTPASLGMEDDDIIEVHVKS
ncbi:hypothetical protein Pint_22071 [Pistacia integerrima]|uniref:Uncharacterized protein n=1 Tax=Pistacia integerrima TaxID=434235 RepID=A0ACC0YLC1_9ROSI|nr:hypothetical protein Pint_22071 [Pistacia integerrima]